MSSGQVGDKNVIQFVFTEANFIGNLALDLVAPEDGFVEELQVIVDKANTSAAGVKVTIGASTDVAGAAVTVAAAAAKGTIYSAIATKGSLTKEFKKGDRLRVVPSGAATAGNITGNILYTTGGKAAL